MVHYAERQSCPDEQEHIDIKRMTVVTHGQTIENIEGIHQGWGVEGKLTELGKRQAQRLARRLGALHFDIIFSSPLGRCKQTLEEILVYHPDTEVVFTNEIRAKKSGKYEGKDRNIIYEDSKKLNLPVFKFRPNDGESIEELQKRVVRFFKNLEDSKFNDILVITHGGVATTWSLYYFTLPLEYYDSVHSPKASVSLYHYSPDSRRYLLVVHNCTKHLEGL